MSTVFKHTNKVTHTDKRSSLGAESRFDAICTCERNENVFGAQRENLNVIFLFCLNSHFHSGWESFAVEKLRLDVKEVKEALKAFVRKRSLISILS